MDQLKDPCIVLFYILPTDTAKASLDSGLKSFTAYT